MSDIPAVLILSSNFDITSMIIFPNLMNSYTQIASKWITVELAQEGDMEAKRQLKEEQAEAKHQANALPVWILQTRSSLNYPMAFCLSTQPLQPAPTAVRMQKTPNLMLILPDYRHPTKKAKVGFAGSAATSPKMLKN
ncbi:hypothetical protein PPACK8108_LOCUS15585 [Phakopsora pachyrhizi]|uniref:Uncharacterized protein n=1 Tax=Phakopsora pachyrhizi TaxID=170000 RepID=A0AAV0B937_PHAPC|nr:hypothetical protein PPACK8108_LOCUS15585 [Phakopsora pachyrhizi]